MEQEAYTKDGFLNFSIASYKTSFLDVITQNLIYVDKSSYIDKLLRFNEPVLITRPRSFGKSMMVNLLKEVLSLGKETFPSLQVASSTLPALQNKYKVLHLDLSLLENLQSELSFKNNLIQQVLDRASQAKIPLSSADPNFYSSSFYSIFKEITQTAPLVLLIDEYDAPLNTVLSQPQQYNEIEKVLRDFFKILKGFASSFSFIYLTGISRCASVGLLSGFNKVCDISYDSRFAGMLGFTESELKQYFAPQLKYIAQHKEISEEQLLKELHAHYNGYCFDEQCQIKVFNPWLITSFFQSPFSSDYPDFWQRVGSLSSILNEHYCLKPFELEKTILNLNVLHNKILLDKQELLSSKCLNQVTSTHYLLLTGYLTLKHKLNNNTYELDYPNRFLKELSQANLIETIRAINHQHVFASTQNKLNIDKILALTTDDQERLKLLQPILAKGDPHLKTIFQQEVLVEVVLSCICSFSSARFIQPEASLGGGRADIVLGFASHNVIIELKRSIDSTQTSAQQKLLNKALQQIDRKNYQHLFMSQDLPLLKIAMLADSKACTIIGIKTQSC